MAQQFIAPVRPCNNDRIGHMTAFRAPVREAAPVYAGVAAPALVSAPPRPMQLDEEQAAVALEAVQQEVVQDGDAMSNVHSGLDAERVARLLGLLQ